MKIIRVGVDLAKNVFQVHGVDRNEKPVWKCKLKRSEWIKVLLEKIEPGCKIGMEACGGAHHWARKLEALGYTVKLIAPQFVKPYVKSNKNDAKDAEAICEAMSRPNMRFVSIKSVEQQDVQAVHRVRAGLMEQRIAKANQIRGPVSEYGLVAPIQVSHLRVAIPEWLEDAENGLTSRFRRLLNGLWSDLQSLDLRLKEMDREIAEIAAANPVAQRLQQLRGVGPMVATALLATVGDASQFKNGRQMAVSLGLTPKQSSSGGKEKLLGISKRGDPYVRSLLVHGARSVMKSAKGKDDRLSQWANRQCPPFQCCSGCHGKQDGTNRMGDDTEGIGLPTRACSRLRSNVEEVTERKGAYQLRLQSKPLDGQQVEPAPEEPVNGRGHKARESNWELAREFPSGSSISNRGAVVRDRIYVSSRTYQSKTDYLQTRWSPYTAVQITNYQHVASNHPPYYNVERKDKRRLQCQTTPHLPARVKQRSPRKFGIVFP